MPDTSSERLAEIIRKRHAHRMLETVHASREEVDDLLAKVSELEDDLDGMREDRADVLRALTDAMAGEEFESEVARLFDRAYRLCGGAP